MGAALVTFYATTTATIFRTTVPTKDAFDDPVDVDVQVGTAVAFSLVERSRKVWDPASGVLRTVLISREIEPCAIPMRPEQSTRGRSGRAM